MPSIIAIPAPWVDKESEMLQLHCNEKPTAPHEGTVKTE